MTDLLEHTAKQIADDLMDLEDFDQEGALKLICELLRPYRELSFEIKRALERGGGDDLTRVFIDIFGELAQLDLELAHWTAARTLQIVGTKLLEAHLAKTIVCAADEVVFEETFEAINMTAFGRSADEIKALTGVRDMHDALDCEQLGFLIMMEAHISRVLHAFDALGREQLGFRIYGEARLRNKLQDCDPLDAEAVARTTQAVLDWMNVTAKEIGVEWPPR